ncbi:MAG: aldo/keto reductase [Bacteroidales bacterium]|nr:aldo/keto reductase [Bacteroidales bacterium]
MEYVTLNNGVKMPILGYGVYQVDPAECERCVADAIRVGYRLIDTAQAYHNEEGVVENHVFFQQTQAREYMRKYHCQPMSWGPFAEGRNGFFTNETLKVIGDRYGKSVAQVALRFLLQQGTVIIPKSTHVERMHQNFDIFDFTLSEADMAEIGTLDTGKSLFFPHPDPATVEQFMIWGK